MGAENPRHAVPYFLVRRVSVTLVGCTLGAGVPGGVSTTTSTGKVPGPLPVASTVATPCPAVIPDSAGTGPATTTLTVGESNSATKPLPRPVACTAMTGKGRLPVSGATEIVTVA